MSTEGFGGQGSVGAGSALAELPTPQERSKRGLGWWSRLPPRRRALTIVVVFAVLAFTGTAINNVLRGSGDPGGARLAQLQRLTSVLPPGTTVLDQGSQEPVWIGSCSDEYFHKGWSMVGYWVEFRPTVPSGQVLADVSRAMARLGWSSKQTVPGGSWRWTRVLTSGAKTTASLVPPVSKTPWAISANATPAAPMGECGGG